MSNSVVGTVYEQIIEDVISTSRVDFEENGVDESVLDALRMVRLSLFSFFAFPVSPVFLRPSSSGHRCLFRAECFSNAGKIRCCRLECLSSHPIVRFCFSGISCVLVLSLCLAVFVRAALDAERGRRLIGPAGGVGGQCLLHPYLTPPRQAAACPVLWCPPAPARG